MIRPHVSSQSYDAIVVGSGPNGLAAAITLARRGRSVLVIEARETIGGGMRSAELTLPGFVHDICSAIHPLGVASPFFLKTPLADFGLEWITPEVSLAHPLLGGSAALVEHSLENTLPSLGEDGPAYRRLIEPLLGGAQELLAQLLGPLRLPRASLLSLLRFGLTGMRSAAGVAKSHFRSDAAQGMFAGMAAHSILPLDHKLTAAVGLMFCLTAHLGGWPLPRGGSQQIAQAMAAYLKSLGGEIVTLWHVKRLVELPSARAILLDVVPRDLVSIVGDALPASYRRQLERFRHGPGSFKVDWALAGPIPWKAAAAARSATVHVGGTFEEIAAAEKAAWSREPAKRPFLLVAQQSLFDASRAPAGKHTGWAYCHVPHGCTFDMTARIEAQMERFAPGFGDQILARHVTTPADLARYNPNYPGGDITGGVMDLRQLFTRPAARWIPYSTPLKNVFICSASTPPGAGVHGMCGYFAAEAALRSVLRD